MHAGRRRGPGPRSSAPPAPARSRARDTGCHIARRKSRSAYGNASASKVARVCASSGRDVVSVTASLALLGRPSSLMSDAACPGRPVQARRPSHRAAYPVEDHDAVSGGRDHARRRHRQAPVVREGELPVLRMDQVHVVRRQVRVEAGRSERSLVHPVRPVADATSRGASAARAAPRSTVGNYPAQTETRATSSRTIGCSSRKRTRRCATRLSTRARRRRARQGINPEHRAINGRGWPPSSPNERAVAVTTRAAREPTFDPTRGPCRMRVDSSRPSGLFCKWTTGSGCRGY
jgi:hypothetical protein